MRAAAAVALLGAVALPVVRRRLAARGVPKAAILAGTAVAPVAAAVLVPRHRARAAIICGLQMYAYVYAYKLPNDDEQALAARVRLDYPIRADRLLGWGELPTVRMQRALHPDGDFHTWEKALVWAHWVWFATPQASLVYIYRRDRARFARAAVLTYAVFDIGAIGYWALPTAPPWWASEQGRMGEGALPVRRLMVEYGEGFWGDRWDMLYAALGGNPLGAMPSLHFATATMGALLLAETGPVAGAVGGAYAAVLGFALVYLGEHYVVDLLAGAALTLAVRRGERLAGAPVRAVGALVERVAAFAQGAGSDAGSAREVVRAEVRVRSWDAPPAEPAADPVPGSQPQA